MIRNALLEEILPSPFFLAPICFVKLVVPTISSWIYKSCVTKNASLLRLETIEVVETRRGEAICVESIQLNMGKKEGKRFITSRWKLLKKRNRRGILGRTSSKNYLLFYDNVQLREWIER